MSGAKAIANQQPQLLGVQVSTCLYNTAIPLIVGTRRTSGRVVWYGYFRNGASGKKGKGAKKGLVTYVANLDVLLGFGPCWNVQSAWNNSSLIGYGEVDSQLINPYSQMKTQVYAVTAASYVTNADGTYTYSDTVNTVTLVSPSTPLIVGRGFTTPMPQSLATSLAVARSMFTGCTFIVHLKGREDRSGET